MACIDGERFEERKIKERVLHSILIQQFCWIVKKRKLMQSKTLVFKYLQNKKSILNLISTKYFAEN